MIGLLRTCSRDSGFNRFTCGWHGKHQSKAFNSPKPPQAPWQLYICTYAGCVCLGCMCKASDQVFWIKMQYQLVCRREIKQIYRIVISHLELNIKTHILGFMNARKQTLYNFLYVSITNWGWISQPLSFNCWRALAAPFWTWGRHLFLTHRPPSQPSPTCCDLTPGFRPSWFGGSIPVLSTHMANTCRLHCIGGLFSGCDWVLAWSMQESHRLFTTSDEGLRRGSCRTFLPCWVRISFHTKETRSVFHWNPPSTSSIKVKWHSSILVEAIAGIFRGPRETGWSCCNFRCSCSTLSISILNWSVTLGSLSIGRHGSALLHLPRSCSKLVLMGLSLLLCQPEIVGLNSWLHMLLFWFLNPSKKASSLPWRSFPSFLQTVVEESFTPNRCVSRSLRSVSSSQICSGSEQT